MANLLTLIPKHLANGYIVDLGDFGTFRLTINSEGSETPEQVTANNIKKVNARFTPGQAFKGTATIFVAKHTTHQPGTKPFYHNWNCC